MLFAAAIAAAAGASLTEIVLGLTAVSLLIAILGKALHVVLRASRFVDGVEALLEWSEAMDEDIEDLKRFLERELGFTERHERRRRRRRAGASAEPRTAPQ